MSGLPDDGGDDRARLPSDRRDLTHLARTPGQPVEVQHALAVRLASAVAATGTVSEEEAHALHLLSFTLSSRIPAADLIAILRTPMDVLDDQARGDLRLARFAALLARTASMAASKLDDYRHAVDVIDRAHRAVVIGPDASPERMLALEALQQVLLQECGQMARNAELALIELDPMRRRQLQIHGEPPVRDLPAARRQQMCRLAWASVRAGMRASGIMEQLRRERELPAAADPDGGHLAVAIWSVTADIMLMRSLLLAATIDLVHGPRREAGQFLLDAVPWLYAKVATLRGVRLLPTHRMDLTRVALHYAFLTQGRSPYTLAPGRAAPGLPAHLVTDGRLDTDACSDELIGARHDAGILDNIAYSSVHGLFDQRSGGLSYTRWLERHRRLRLGLGGGPDERLRLARVRPTLSDVEYVSRRAHRTRRFGPVAGGPAITVPVPRGARDGQVEVVRPAPRNPGW